MLLKDSSYFYCDDRQHGGGRSVGALAARFLDGFDGHTGISTQLLILRYKQDRLLGIVYCGRGMFRGFGGLYGVAHHGITKIVAAMLEMKEWMLVRPIAPCSIIGFPILFDHITMSVVRHTHAIICLLM